MICALIILFYLLQILLIQWMEIFPRSQVWWILDGAHNICRHTYFRIFIFFILIFIFSYHAVRRAKIFPSEKRNSPSFEKMLLLQVSRRVVETSHVVNFFAVSAPFLQFPPALVLRFLISPTFIFPVLGAGDTAFDCATSALRCGAKRVFVIFRKVVQFKESFSPSQVILL